MPEETIHPLESTMEAILMNQDSNSKEHTKTLELLLEQNHLSNPETILDLQLLQSAKGTSEIVQAIKDIPIINLPEDKEVDLTETNKLLREISDEVKKKEEYEYEVKIDANLKKELKGDKGDKGSTGKDGRNGIDGKDGINGKDGKRGPKGEPGKNLTQEDIEKISKGLNKTKKENFLFANTGVNEIHAGTNITIDNSNPQNPIISSTGGSSLTPATTVVSETSAGQSPIVGVSTNYAREDHSHGTPAAGAGSGDLLRLSAYGIISLRI